MTTSELTPVPRPSTPHPTAQTLNPTGTASATTHSAPTTTAKATADRLCTSSHLRLAYAGKDGAAGTSYFNYSLTNTGLTTCTTKGYPGVSYLGAAGHLVQHAAHHNGGTDQRITITAGHAGYFTVASSSFPNANCPHLFHGSRLRVYPPNNTTPLYLDEPRDICDLLVGTIETG